MPIIFLCENNHYAATTSVEASTCTEDIAPRAEAYNLPWAICDGNDVLDVFRTVQPAIERARQGDGATMIEAKTYRAEPHCGIIEDTRCPQELTSWKSSERDPIPRFEAVLLAEGALTREEIDAVHEQVEHELEEAVDFARQSSVPTVGDTAAMGVV